MARTSIQKCFAIEIVALPEVLILLKNLPQRAAIPLHYLRIIQIDFFQGPAVRYGHQHFWVTLELVEIETENFQGLRDACAEESFEPPSTEPREPAVVEVQLLQFASINQCNVKFTI